ncbi:FAD-binding oxidoreductase [Streptomyces sp. NPDC058335]|uniref:FAD-binding oxidoreductase n=1 Tax=Streptomyces sp. NPDC058335 TaxID=3346451 RepID=UPI003651878F
MLSRRSLLRAGGGVTAAAVALGAAPASAGHRTEWDRLRGRVQGDVVLPSDAGYDTAKQLQIAEYDSANPRAVVYCETESDVRTCVLFSQYNGIPVRIRSGGHNLAGWSTGDGLVIDLSRMSHVRVGSRTVHAGPGTQSVDAMRRLEPYNKQFATGTCPTVCLGGFVSGGGVGWQTRKFGLGADRIVSARVALADGRVVRCSATEEPDLFWAVRGGGGGNFGVVVDFEVLPIEAPTMVMYSTAWSWDQAPEVLTAWQEWTTSAAKDLGSSLLVVPPNDSGSGAPLLRIFGGHYGTQAALDGALDELAERVGATPMQRSANLMPFATAMKTAYGCGELTAEQCQRAGTNPDAVLPRTPYQRQEYRLTNRTTTNSQAAALLSAWDSHRSLKHRYLQVIALGGAASEVRPEDSAFFHRDARFLVGYQVGLDSAAPPAEERADVDAWTGGGASALEPVASGSYINFPTTRLVTGWGADNYGANYARLRRVKTAYDPTGFFRHPRSIGSG